MATMADVMHRFSAAYIKQYPTNPQQLRLVHDILACRTRQLGSHTSACTGCGEVKVHYNSCGNRGCPNCQGTNKEKWVLERTHDLLPVKHFHMVFTLPAQLRAICWQNQKLVYNLLFKCAWQTPGGIFQRPCTKAGSKHGDGGRAPHLDTAAALPPTRALYCPRQGELQRMESGSTPKARGNSCSM